MNKGQQDMLSANDESNEASTWRLDSGMRPIDVQTFGQLTAERHI